MLPLWWLVQVSLMHVSKEHFVPLNTVQGTMFEGINKIFICWMCAIDSQDSWVPRVGTTALFISAKLTMRLHQSEIVSQEEKSGPLVFTECSDPYCFWFVVFWLPGVSLKPLYVSWWWIFLWVVVCTVSQFFLITWQYLQKSELLLCSGALSQLDRGSR